MHYNYNRDVPVRVFIFATLAGEYPSPLRVISYQNERTLKLRTFPTLISYNDSFICLCCSMAVSVCSRRAVTRVLTSLCSSLTTLL